MKKNIHVFIDSDLYYRAVGLFEKYQVTSVQKLIIAMLKKELGEDKVSLLALKKQLLNE